MKLERLKDNCAYVRRKACEKSTEKKILKFIYNIENIAIKYLGHLSPKER